MQLAPGPAYLSSFWDLQLWYAFLSSSVQQNENRKLDLQKAQIEDKKKRRLEEAQHDRDAARTSIHDRYRIVTLLLAAVPGLLLGAFTWYRRSSRAADCQHKSPTPPQQMPAQ